MSDKFISWDKNSKTLILYCMYVLIFIENDIITVENFEKVLQVERQYYNGFVAMERVRLFFLNKFVSRTCQHFSMFNISKWKMRNSP